MKKITQTCIFSLCAAASLYAMPTLACSPAPDALSTVELPFLQEALKTPGLADAIKATGRQDQASLYSKVIKTITYHSAVNYTLTTNEGCTLELSGTFTRPEHPGQCPHFEGFKVKAGSCPKMVENEQD